VNQFLIYGVVKDEEALENLFEALYYKPLEDFDNSGGFTHVDTVEGEALVVTK
jgi:hypothetical protein